MLRRLGAPLSIQAGLFFGDISLNTGAGKLKRHVSKDQLRQLRQAQETEPVLLWDTGISKYWWFKKVVYQDDHGMDAEQVYALLVTKEQARNRQIERAQAVVAQGPSDTERQRGHISAEVRNYVFQRDGGRCVTCQSSAELQFDHIIPVALGGSSEPENLQVLCGPCNRRKGASLG
jgi:hypothetical protein